MEKSGMFRMAEPQKIKNNSDNIVDPTGEHT